MGRSLVAELKRRNVIRVAVAYLAVSWLVLQAGALIFQALDLPNALLKGLLAVLLIGFIPTLVFSWVYELTPEGLRRESEVERDESITHLTGRKLDYLVIGVLGAIVGLLLIDKFVLSPRLAARAASNLPAPPAPAATETAAVATPSPVPGPSPASIAVLPFVDMSQSHDQEYFSDGIAEELLNLLAKIPQLHVAARTSSFSFKGKEVPIPEIAKTLLVANVLEGSIRKSGEQVRITAQLVRAADGYHLWSETYDRKLDDIFKVQDEISAKVVDELKVSLLGAAPRVRTTDAKAYALFLQAREVGQLNTTDAIARSNAMLREVLATDAGYAPAWVMLAKNSTNGASLGIVTNDEGYSRAREAAEKALAADPDNASAYAVLGFIDDAFGDQAAAAKHFERALALDPTDIAVLRNVVSYLGDLGRLDEALLLDAAIVSHDPVNVSALVGSASRLISSGRYDGAIAVLNTALTLNPERGQAYFNVTVSQLLRGNAAGALTAIERETSEVWRSIGLPMVYYALGRKVDSDAALAAMIGKYEKDAAFNIAYVYAFRGDADKAFEWLDKAVAYRDPGLSEILMSRLFDKVHADPRWLPFLRRIGKAPEQLAKIEFKVTLPKEWQAEAKSAAPPPPG
jgi:TolB-like protein/Flp pilus assembly protein TadD